MVLFSCNNQRNEFIGDYYHSRQLHPEIVNSELRNNIVFSINKDGSGYSNSEFKSSNTFGKNKNSGKFIWSLEKSYRKDEILFQIKWENGELTTGKLIPGKFGKNILFLVIYDPLKKYIFQEVGEKMSKEELVEESKIPIQLKSSLDVKKGEGNNTDYNKYNGKFVDEFSFNYPSDWIYIEDFMESCPIFLKSGRNDYLPNAQVYIMKTVYDKTSSKDVVRKIMSKIPKSKLLVNNEYSMNGLIGHRYEIVYTNSINGMEMRNIGYYLRESSENMYGYLISATISEENYFRDEEDIRKIVESFHFAKTREQKLNGTNNEDIKEFMDGKSKDYKTDGLGKSKGLKVKIRYPENWIAMDGERPNIVQKFESNDKHIGFLLQITKFDENSMSDDEIDMELGYIPDYATLRNASLDFKIDGEKAKRLEYSFKRNNTVLGKNVEFTIYAVSYNIVYKDYFILLQGYVGKSSFEEFDINSVFNEYQFLFDQMANSLVINSKWENYY